MDAVASRRASNVPAAQHAGVDWWHDTSALAFALSRAQHDSAESHYRFGDAHLALAAPPWLRTEIEDRYGDCAVPVGPDSGAASLRCSVQARGDGLALVDFVAPIVDAVGTALALLEHPVGKPLYREVPSSVSGWRLIASTTTGLPLVAARGGLLIVDAPNAPEGFLVDLLLSPVLAMQRELLFVHAASIEIGGRGVLLIGTSGSGKTTAALPLAARGHGYLGDDMAVLHARSADLL